MFSTRPLLGVWPKRRAAIPIGPRPHMDVIPATKTVTRALDSSATSDADTDQQQIDTI